MEERRLETFLTAARVGSFSRAAQVLFVSQSSVTARIRELERELGAALFVRKGRGVELSEAGRAFIPHAHRCLQSFEEGREAVAATRLGPVMGLRVVACHVPAAYHLPPALAALRGGPRGGRRSPHIQVESLPSKRAFRRLLEGEADLGLVNIHFRHPELETELLTESPFRLVALAGGGPVAEGPLLFFQEEADDALVARSVCHQLGWPGESVMGMSDMTALKNLLMAGFGAAALLPQEAIAAELAAGKLQDLVPGNFQDDPGQGDAAGRPAVPLPKQVTCLLMRRDLRKERHFRAAERLIRQLRRVKPGDTGQPS